MSSTGNYLSVHLSGRGFHERINDLFISAKKARNEEDLEKIKKSIQYIAKRFTRILCEFSTSVSKEGIKSTDKTLPSQQVNKKIRKVPEDWKPIEQAFQNDNNGDTPGCLTPTDYGYTLTDYRTGDVCSYDYKAECIMMLITHNKIEEVKTLIDNGVDLRRFWIQRMCHAGGGMRDWITEQVKAYVWLNQLLIIESTNNTISTKTGQNQWGTYSQTNLQPPAGLTTIPQKEAIRLMAVTSLFQSLSVYDNRSHLEVRRYHEMRTYLLNNDTLDLHVIREYVKNIIFPDLYRTIYLFRYNYIQRNKLPGKLIENCDVRVERLDLVIEGMIMQSLEEVIAAVTFVHGVKFPFSSESDVGYHDLMEGDSRE